MTVMIIMTFDFHDDYDVYNDVNEDYEACDDYEVYHSDLDDYDSHHDYDHNDGYHTHLSFWSYFIFYGNEQII